MSETSVYNVAKYIIENFKEPITAMKLQRLVYYCQVWSVVWDEKILFNEHIYAWANGPIVKELYEIHKGKFLVTNIDGGDVEKLDEDQRDTVLLVLKSYGNKSAQWLSELTRLEAPWITAREGLAPGERGHKIISISSIHEYYSGLDSITNKAL